MHAVTGDVGKDRAECVQEGHSFDGHSSAANVKKHLSLSRGGCEIAFNLSTPLKLKLCVRNSYRTTLRVVRSGRFRFLAWHGQRNASFDARESQVLCDL